MTECRHERVDCADSIDRVSTAGVALKRESAGNGPTVGTAVNEWWVPEHWRRRTCRKGRPLEE